MRADRLLAILMLLQARGRMTAAALANELEVSVRTIYRDVDSLSAAGVPVYTERGRGGGCALLDDYRTTLTGLREDEMRALFMLSIPAPLAELGVAPDLEAALRKLSAALPAARRADEARVRQSVHVDPAPWRERAAPAPQLHAIHRAVWEDRRLRLTRRLPFDTHLEQLVDPYGLVAKADEWFLVCAADGHVIAHRVAEIVAARPTDARFTRPPGFDLAAFWATWCATAEGNRPHFAATVRVAPGLAPHLPALLGDAARGSVAEAGPPDDQGRLTLRLDFDSLETARAWVLRLGGAVEVLAPPALRDTVADFGARIAAVYTDGR